MNIFVGNLSFEATEQDVLKLFRQFGEVHSITILMDKNGKKSRGFGFLEMPDDDKAKAAIAALEGSEFMGRNLNVSPARPKEEKKPPREERKPFARDERESRPRPDLEEHGRPRPYQDGGDRPQQFQQYDGPRQGPRMSERPGRIKNGRRSRSFLRRTGGYQAQAQGQPRPQAPGPAARWHQRNERPVREEAARPWGREQEAGGEVVQVRRNLKPWQKRKSYMSKQHAEAKPWRKHAGASKPAWQKDAPRPWKKPDGESRPWKKPEGEARPWKKTGGAARPWKKSAGAARPAAGRPAWKKKKPGAFKR